MTGETVDTIGPLWTVVIAIAVFVAAVVWAEWRQEKDDVQTLIDERKDRARLSQRDA